VSGRAFLPCSFRPVPHPLRRRTVSCALPAGQSPTNCHRTAPPTSTPTVTCRPVPARKASSQRDQPPLNCRQPAATSGRLDVRADQSRASGPRSPVSASAPIPRPCCVSRHRRPNRRVLASTSARPFGEHERQQSTHPTAPILLREVSAHEYTLPCRSTSRRASRSAWLALVVRGPRTRNCVAHTCRLPVGLPRVASAEPPTLVTRSRARRPDLRSQRVHSRQLHRKCVKGISDSIPRASRSSVSKGGRAAVGLYKTASVDVRP